LWILLCVSRGKLNRSEPGRLETLPVGPGVAVDGVERLKPPRVGDDRAAGDGSEGMVDQLQIPIGRCQRTEIEQRVDYSAGGDELAVDEGSGLGGTGVNSDQVQSLASP